MMFRAINWPAFWVLLWLLALSTAARAESVQTLRMTDAPAQSIGQSLVYLSVPDDHWQAETLSLQLDQLDWTASQVETPNLGLQAAPTWFALRLQSDRDATRLLEISYPVLNEVDVFWFRDGQPVQAVHTGNGRPFQSRPIAHRNFVIPLEMQQGAAHLLLIRAHTGGALQMPAVLWQPTAFLVEDQKAFGVIMVFAGIMLAMAIYNLLLYTSVRESSYLWYVVSVVAIAWAQLGLRGVPFQYVWPNHPQWNEIGLTTAIALNIIAVAFFSDRFLNIRQTSRVTSWIVRGFGWVGLVLMVFAFFVPYATSIRPLILVAFVSSLMVFVLGFYLWYKGEVLARYYVVAWSLFLLGTAIYSLNKAGILPYTPLYEYAMIIGAAFQVLFLSFSLAYRINLERQRRQEAQTALFQVQADALQLQRSTNEQLESRVRERTEALELAYRELKRLSQIDGLTKVKNRQWFDQELETEWRRNTRESTNISLLMLDADYFKKINDTWGHPCGDACLQYIATICGNAVMRAGDTVARYGGEEFVILLPYTDQQGAEGVAERIRQDIEGSGFVWKGESIRLTVSIGIASCVPERGISYEQLVQQADQALYAAKAAGRNCVRFYQEQITSDGS